jgi:hypothetical protein
VTQALQMPTAPTGKPVKPTPQRLRCSDCRAWSLRGDPDPDGSRRCVAHSKRPDAWEMRARGALNSGRPPHTSDGAVTAAPVRLQTREDILAALERAASIAFARGDVAVAVQALRTAVAALQMPETMRQDDELGGFTIRVVGRTGVQAS